MEILKFENSPRPVRKKSSSSKVVLGLASIAAVAMLGSTLAASITLNTNNTVEFGQGVAQTTACDPIITTTPAAAFTNASGAGSFKLASVTLSGIASECVGKKFTLKAYDNTDDAGLQDIFTADGLVGGTTVDVLEFTLLADETLRDASVTLGATIGDYTAASDNLATGGGNGSVEILFTYPLADSASVNKLTLESSNAS